MTAPVSPPTYLYKIVPSSTPPPTPLPEALPLSPLDKKDGFIHLSTSSQLLTTLSKFFASDTSVYLLRIPYSRIGNFIVWESVSGEAAAGEWDWKSAEGKANYPHVYSNGPEEFACGRGIRLGKEEVEKVGEWKRNGEAWSKNGWPFEDDIPA